MKHCILFLAIILLPVAVSAQSGTTGRLTWSVSDSTLTIRGTGAMQNYDLDNINSREYIFHGKSEDITAVIIENGVTHIGDWAFFNCTGLTSVTLPNSVKTIGARAFYGCRSLTSIVIPNSVTEIRQDAFYGCSGLTSVTLQGSIAIRVGAFVRCKALKDVYVECATLPDIPSLGGIKPKSCTLHVPAGTASLYRDAGGYWRRFKSIVEMPAGQ